MTANGLYLYLVLWLVCISSLKMAFKESMQTDEVKDAVKGLGKKYFGAMVSFMLFEIGMLWFFCQFVMYKLTEG